MAETKGRKEVRFTIATETATAIAKYAENQEIGVGEAVDKLIGTAVSRLNALKRYAKNQKADAVKASSKKKAKKAAKRSAANGAAAHA